MNASALAFDLDRHHARTLRDVLRALSEFALIVAALAIVNALASPRDPGWLGLNPTPFFLVPILLGVRHGPATGFVSGAATAGLMILARQMSPGTPVMDSRFVLAFLPLLGLVVGQSSEFLRQRSRENETANRDLAGENRNLRAERHLLFLAKQDLQQRLGLYGANAASLHEDLAELADCDPASAPAVLLATLQRLTRVRSAAVYELTDPRRKELTRRAVIGEASRFPEILAGADDHLVSEAIARRCFLAQEGLLRPIPGRDPGFLLASPASNSNGEVNHLVIVQDLPFPEISRRNLSTIKSICDWFSAFVINPADSPSHHKAVSQTDFFTAIETAITTHTEHALPSTLVRLPFPNGSTGSMTRAFSEFLDKLPGPALLTHAIEDGKRSLLFLFPAKAGRELGEALHRALRDFAQHLGLPEPPAPDIHLTLPNGSPQQLWGQLLATT